LTVAGFKWVGITDPDRRIGGCAAYPTKYAPAILELRNERHVHSEMLPYSVDYGLNAACFVLFVGQFPLAQEFCQGEGGGFSSYLPFPATHAGARW
jgi:hypothetical protein